MVTALKILLINPWIVDFAAFDFWIKPLGLLYVGSYLRELGHELGLIDCVHAFERTGGDGSHRLCREEVLKPDALAFMPRHYKRYGISESEFIRRLVSFGHPDMIAVTSMMTYWYPGVDDVIRSCQQIYPDVPVVLGGVYTSLCRQHAEQHWPRVHVLAGGDLDHLARSLSSIIPLSLSEPRSMQLFDLRPAYDLYDELDSVAMITSLGCPLHCSYCASSILQPGFVQNQVAAVLAEISYYADTLGVHEIAFYDDALLVNSAQHFKAILEGIIAMDTKVRFHTPNGLHVKLIDEALAKLMYEANIRSLRLSFESSDPARQLDSSAKVGNQDLVAALENLARAGYKPQDLAAYVLVGLPGQDLAEVRASVVFVHGLGLRVHLAEFSPVPGTAEYHKACRLYPLIVDEPLLTNNKVFPYLAGERNYQETNHLKSWVKHLNETVVD